MSRSAYLEINYHGKSYTKYDLILALLRAGWTLKDEGMITFLPMHDQDYAWSTTSSDNESFVLNTVQHKEVLGEVLGLVMLWRDSRIGGQFLFHKESILSLNLTRNRKELEEAANFTDVNWYLMRFLPPLLNVGVLVESIT